MSIVTYSWHGNQVYRQEGVGVNLAITSNTNNVTNFLVTDLSSSSAAGAIKINISISNYPSGTLKPSITENLVTAMSLRFI